MRIVCQNPNLVNSLSVMCCSSNTHLGTYLVLAYPISGSPGGGGHTGDIFSALYSTPQAQLYEFFIMSIVHV